MSAATVLGGVIGLAVLEAVVTSSAATDRVGGAFTMLASGIERFLSPSLAAIPDLRKQKPAEPSAGSLTTPTLPPDWTVGIGGGTAIPTSVQSLQV